MTITVRFTGICTHLPLTGAEFHRVVLVKAENGANINGKAIAPHIPKLKIDPAKIKRIEGYPYGLEPTERPGAWRLAGVHLKLEGTLDTPIEPIEVLASVPQLQSPERHALELNGDVVVKEMAACHFDLYSGTMFRDELPYGAIMTRVEVKTTSEPVLVVTCFWNQQTSRIYLDPETEIEIEHTGYQHGDSDQDFLLHYRVFSHIPDDAFVPKKSKSELKRIPGDISIGCSNSRYP